MDRETLSGRSGSLAEPAMPGGTGEMSGKVSDIRKIASDTLGIPIREGNVRGKDVLGYIDNVKQVIRTKYKNDVAVTLHEFGHAIDNRFSLSKNSNAVLEELSGFGRMMGYPKNKHISEGLAQFFQWRGVDPEQARVQFPVYSKVFDSFLAANPEAKALIDPVFNAAYEYYHASPRARLEAVISYGKRDKVPLRQKIRDVFDSAYIQMVDRHYMFRKVNEKIADALGVPRRMIPDSYNLEAWVRTYPGHRKQAELSMGKLSSVLEGVDVSDLQFLDDYFVAGNALDYFQNDLEPGVGLSKAELEVIRHETPDNVKAKAEEFHAVYRKMTHDTLVRSGLVSEKMWKSWKEKWPNYTPMIAESSNGDIELLTPYQAMKRGFVDQPNPIRGRRGAGSDRDVIMRQSPIAVMMENAAKYHAIAAKNDVSKIVMNVSKLPGLASAAEAVPGPGDRGDLTFYVWDGGKKKYFATNPEVYTGLNALYDTGIPKNFIMKLARMPSELLKMGATRYNPWFIPRNLIRDALTVSVQSESGISDISTFPVYNSIKGFIELTGDNPEQVRRRMADANAGLFNSGITEMVKGQTGDYLKRLNRQSNVSGIKRIMERLGTANENIEASVKVREFDLLRSKGIPAKQAAMEAREVNIDFHRSGAVGRILNQYIPFFNAQIQGLDKAVRTFKDHPVRSSLKASMYIVLPSLIEWAIYHDDEEYQRLEQGIKDTNWVFKMPGGEKDEFVRLPMPFEIGVLFGGGTKRMLDKMFRSDPAAWFGFSDSVNEALWPDVLPTVLKPWIEVWANKDFVRNRPVVPVKEQKLPERMQYGDSTSYLAKEIGNAFNISPRNIDHLIRGHGAQMGSQAVHMLDYFEKGRTPQPSRRLSQNPLIRPFAANSQSMSAPIRRFYDIADSLEREMNGAKKERSAPPALAKELARRRDGLNKIWKAAAEIRGSVNMTPEEKRKRITALNEQAALIAENGLKNYDRLKVKR